MTDTRTDPPFIADERAMLVAWLDWHRATLQAKCDGVPAARLAERTVPPSSLSLLGLVRHMTEVERNSFRRVISGEEVTPLYYSEADPDGDFDNVGRTDAEEAFATWRAECANSRAVVEAAESLDVTGRRRDADVSLRWVLVHMVEEYARHNGHADLLRERLDGVTGE